MVAVSFVGALCAAVFIVSPMLVLLTL